MSLLLLRVALKIEFIQTHFLFGSLYKTYSNRPCNNEAEIIWNTYKCDYDTQRFRYTYYN